MRLIYSLLFLLTLSGCALFRENSGPPETFAVRDELYYGSFDQVWRATQLALQNYPMKINNMDLGVIETEQVKGYKVWMPPYKTEQTSGGMAYALNVRLIKGKSQGRDVVKVSILKETQIQKDFFSEPQRMPSDGLEEKSILYRIGRELQIERALERAQEKANKKNNS